MGGRAPLRAGAPRLLSSHGGIGGRAYRRAWAAILAETGPLTDAPLLRLMAGRVAVLWCSFEAATRAMSVAQEQRETGRGRRPTMAALDRLEHRLQVASREYGEALDKLMGSEAVAKLKQERATAALRARVGARRGESAAPVAKAAPGALDESRQGEDEVARG